MMDREDHAQLHVHTCVPGRWTPLAWPLVGIGLAWLAALALSLISAWGSGGPLRVTEAVAWDMVCRRGREVKWKQASAAPARTQWYWPGR